MKRLDFVIGIVMFFGVSVSFLIVMTGGFIYLLHHGSEIIHYQAFHGEPVGYRSIADIFWDVFTFSGRAIIQFGLFSLVLVQILRVGLTGWMFVESRDKLFVGMSVFILGVMVFSLVSPV